MDQKTKRVKLERGTDLAGLLEEIRTDHEPRVIESDGEDVAVILSADAYFDLTAEPKSRRNKARLLALAGVWKDLDADELTERIYRRRHEAPPSPPVNL